jgi:pSer/pThr/pTyr-binding forkhead associated (FHA) protein
MTLVEISDPSQPLQTFEMDANSFTIGRSKTAGITLKVDGISREHLRIDIEGEQIFITDLGSSNGVFINEEKIEPNIKVEYHSFLPLTICAKIGIVLSCS